MCSGKGGWMELLQFCVHWQAMLLGVLNIQVLPDSYIRKCV